VHVDFAGGADSGSRAEFEFFFGSSFGEGEELFGDVAEFAVVALPKAVERIGRLRAGGEWEGEEN